MANPIVTVNVSQTQAPTPSLLQKTGALISQGGTVLAAGMYSLLTQPSDLTPLLSAPLALDTLTWASSFGGQVTAATSVAHGVPVNEQFITTIAGASPAGYNGTVIATSTGASSFTYYLTANPGVMVTPGTYTPKNVAELVAMANTFFTQQAAAQSVYVLELGAGTVAAGVAALDDFIDSSPQFFYSYLVPRLWAADPTFQTYVTNYTSTTAKTYFFVTVNRQTMVPFVAQADKSVVALVEAPSYSAWASINVNTVTWSVGVATATMASNHGIKPNQTFTLQGIVAATIAGGYNGTFIALPGTTGTALVYALADDPGAYVSGGTLLKSTYSSAGVPASQFDHASDYYVTLNYDPSSTNKVTPFAFSALFGVTQFPTLGNNALISTLNSNHVNYVGSGAEGGISGNYLFNGQTMDGRSFNYWYAVDWMQIMAKRGLANAVINGSNNPLNPLYYNQDGINRLQQALASICGTAITVGLALGKVILLEQDGPTFAATLSSGRYAGNVIVNAVPFVPYLTVSPSHYREGIYNGLSITFTPQLGFLSITVDINVTDFVTG